jgi:hypothetical protein
MKHLTLLESSIVGFFVGVVASTYVLFLEGTGAYISPILYFVSLRPLIEFISLPETVFYIVEFLCILAVYTIYGCIAGILIRKSMKNKIFVWIIFLLFIGIVVFQQITGSAPASPSPVYSSTDISHALAQKNKVKANEQYFGSEVAGDLNGDGISDVAFVISRADPERGTLYYIVTALAGEKGHTGTNLLFLGDKAEPQVISITDGIVGVSYIDRSNKTSTSTQYFYAQVLDGKLEQINITGKGNYLAWGQVSLDGDTPVFTQCKSTEILPILGASTTLSTIHDRITQINPSSSETKELFGVFIGNTLSSKGFSLKNIVTLTPQGVCP